MSLPDVMDLDDYEKHSRSRKRQRREKGVTEQKDRTYHMTHQEIGDVLGISANAVNQTERRALRKLRKQWEAMKNDSPKA